MTHATPLTKLAGYAGRDITKPPNWHSLVVWDVLLNGMTTGLFLVAGVAELARPDLFRELARWAYLFAFIFLMIDLLFLVLDLGHRARFHHMLRVFKPSSPMSLGTWCLTVYSLPLTAIVALDLLGLQGAFWHSAHIALVIAGLLPALGSCVYKGVLFSTGAQPGWKDARWLGGYLANSAIVFGCAEMLILSHAMGETNSTRLLRTALAVLVGLNFVPWLLLGRELLPELRRRHLRQQLMLIGWVSIVVGVVLPLAFLAIGGKVGEMAAGLCIFMAGFISRAVIVHLPARPLM